MKTKILNLLLITVLTFLVSCDINDDTTYQPPVINLDGSWDLKKVYIPMTNTNIDYAVGEVNWQFDMKYNKVIIENNVMTTGPEDIYSGLESGGYDFSIQNVDGEAVLYVNGIRQGVILVYGDILTIDTGIAYDGYIITFTRNTSKPPIKDLDGSWNLKNVYMPMTNINYAIGDVNWEFFMENKKVIVTNNIWTTGPEDLYSGLKSGTYDFSIEQVDSEAVLYINGMRQGAFIVSGDILTIDTGIALDGHVTTFTRNTTKNLSGYYKGIFERNGKTANVELTLDNDTFSGHSDTDGFPAICDGVIWASDSTISFGNACIWTADFDWTLILNESWNYNLTSNVLTLTKHNGDKYVLTRQTYK